MKRWTRESVFLLTLCLSVLPRKFFFISVDFLSFFKLIYLSDVVYNIVVRKAVLSSGDFKKKPYQSTLSL